MQQDSAFRHGLGDVDAASMETGRRLETSLDELNRAGIAASGEIGDSDPLVTAGDALPQFSADEVLIAMAVALISASPPHPDLRGAFYAYRAA